MKTVTTSPQIIVDPVCLNKVDPVRADLMYTYKMRSYYFCTEACRKSFEANPTKYLAPELFKRKGWWGRYLARLNKATGGKSLDCH